MAVTSGFFDSRNGDRKYNADQMSEYFRGIVSGGVFQHLDGGLQVTAGTGLAVNVAAGRAIVQNRWIQNSASLPLSISAASETYGRKDAVVLRLDSAARTVSITVKAGTPAASPAAPEMTRSGGVYEMALAYVNVAAGATSVTVTDKRSDSTVCGWATVAQSTSGEVDQQLNDMKTGFDGVVYDSPAAMVRGEDQKLKDEIDTEKENTRSLLIGAEGIKANYDAFLINEMIQGAYMNADGNYLYRTDYICNKNKIRVNPGDLITVKVITEVAVAGYFYVQGYDLNGDFISATAAVGFGPNWQTNFVVPENYYYINLSFNKQYQVPISVDTYKFMLYINYDFTTQDEIDTVKSEADNGVIITRYKVLSTDIAQGLWKADSVPDSESVVATKRIRTSTYYKCTKGSKLFFRAYNNEAISIKVFANVPGTTQAALQETIWLTGSDVFDILYDGYIVANIKFLSEGAITPSDFSFDIYVPVSSNTPYVERIENIESEIQGVGNMPYYGEKIRLNPYYFNAEKVGDMSISGYVPQGACIYGDKLFQMYAESKFSVYNLLTNTVSSIFSMDANTPSLHANSACFGNKANSADAYPLLYINSYLDSGVAKGVCCVEKIIESNGSYTTQHIQTITIGFTDQTIWTGETVNPSTLANGNFIVDTVSNRLIAYTTQGFDRTRFFIFELPDISESTVTLQQSDILDYFDVAYIANIQDSCIHNGMLYMTAGIDWGEYDQILRIYAINVDGRSITSEIRLEEIPLLNVEPEGIDYYDDALIMTQTRGYVIKLTF